MRCSQSQASSTQWVFPAICPDEPQASLAINIYSNARGGPSTLIETQVVRSKSELLKELQGLPVTKAIIYRNVDRKAWEQIAKEHSGVRVVITLL